MIVVLLILFFAGFSDVAISHEYSRHESDLYNLTFNFMNELNDFADRKLNYDFFPLSKAMEFNRISGRPDNNVTGKPDYGSIVSANLSKWRGFIEVTNMDLETDMGFLFNESSFEINLDETVERNYLEELPLGWQYLLPSKYYLRLNLSGEAWAGMVDSPQKNSDLFFKIAILLRNESNFVKDQFIIHARSPNELYDDLSYILGNRWFVDTHNLGDDFHTKTLVHLPVETVMGIEHKDFVNMKAIERLHEDGSAWKMADARAVVAWFSKVKKEIGWSRIAGSSEDIRKYGSLLSGAPLDLLRELTEGYNSKVVSELLKETDMNALRVQELWESLALEERVGSFPVQAQKLDVTQIFSYFDEKIDHHRNEKAFLDLELLTDTDEVPWTNIMVIGER